MNLTFYVVAMLTYACALVCFIAYLYKRMVNNKNGVLKIVFKTSFILLALGAFWDFIPTLVTHEYLCRKDGGFYSSLNATMPNESYVQAVMEKISLDRPANLTSWETILTNRYRTFSTTNDEPFSIRRKERILYDTKEKRAIAKTVQYRKINTLALPLGNGTLHEDAGVRSCVLPINYLGGSFSSKAKGKT